MWSRALIACIIIFPVLVLAQVPIIENENLPRSCKPTPALPGASGSYPGRERIIPSNKPAKPAGKAVFAKGEIMYLQGRVFDENCVPIEGASIELWQADTQGQYKWEKMGKLLAPDPAFAGTGQAITNNLGEYQFLTVFPGTRGKRAPHVNLRITHSDFETLTTAIFFEQDYRNTRDPRLSALPPENQLRLLASMSLPNPAHPEPYLVALADIVLKGHNKFKRY